MKKFAGDIIILHMCPKNHNHMMYGSWYTEWDRQDFFVILGHFLSFYHPFAPPNDLKKSKFWKRKRKKCLDILSFYTYMYSINEHHMIYGFWNLRCDRQKVLSFWVIFCPFSPLTTQKIKILKLKKAPGDIIILHICTIHDNHMMYVSWEMEREGQNLLSLWTNSYPFTPLPPFLFL